MVEAASGCSPEGLYFGLFEAGMKPSFEKRSVPS